MLFFKSPPSQLSLVLLPLDAVHLQFRRPWSPPSPNLWSQSSNLRCRRGTNSFKTDSPISRHPPPAHPRLHLEHLRWAQSWLMASPERPPLSMSDLNVEYITPACPIWMSHNRCFHVLRSITDLSGRSSSRAVPLIGLCRCQRNWRRLWCRLTSRIGPQCLWQKHRLN